MLEFVTNKCGLTMFNMLEASLLRLGETAVVVSAWLYGMINPSFANISGKATSNQDVAGHPRAKIPKGLGPIPSHTPYQCQRTFFWIWFSHVLPSKAVLVIPPAI